MSKVITIGSYKGGVGKSANSCLISFTLAKMGYKVLVVDMDSQANSTKTLMLTKNRIEKETDQEVRPIERTLLASFQKGTFVGSEIKIMENLYLLPNFVDFQDFARFLYTNFQTQEERDYCLKKLLDEIKNEYDYVFIDTPPMNKEISRSAVIASDYVLISLQTQEHSLTGAENFIQDLITIKGEYDLNIDLLGILCVLQKNGGKVDEYIIEQAIEDFGPENIFKTKIRQMERIKRFDVNGISDRGVHDKKVMKVYEEVASELLERLGDNIDGE